jgi:toxin ParE1/3/4
MRNVVRTPAVMRDLVAITDYIAADNLTAALVLYDEIDRLLTMIAQYPEMGEAVDDLSPSLRRFTFGNYVLFYRTGDAEIELIRVLHGVRDIDRLF